MADAVAERAVERRPIVQGVHLVDAQGVEPVGVRLDGVEHGHRFAVGQRDDDVTGALEVVEHGVGGARAGWQHGSELFQPAPRYRFGSPRGTPGG